MSRALDLELVPESSRGTRDTLSVQIYVYAPVDEKTGQPMPFGMAHDVNLDIRVRGGYLGTVLSSHEARKLARHLEQCAELTDEHRNPADRAQLVARMLAPDGVAP